MHGRCSHREPWPLLPLCDFLQLFWLDSVGLRWNLLVCVCVCVCILKRDKRNFDKSENKTQSRHGAVGQPGCSAVHTLYYTRDCITQSAVVLHMWLYYVQCSFITHVIVLYRVQLYYTTWLYYIECICITHNVIVLHRAQLYCIRDCVTYSAVVLHTMWRSPVVCSPESQGARSLYPQSSESRRDRSIDYGVS